MKGTTMRITLPTATGGTLAVGFGLLVLGLLSPVAFGDEVDVIDLNTCERQTIKVAEVVSETWANVTVRRKRAGRGPTEDIPTITVVDVRRSDTSDRTSETVGAAMAEINRGNFAEAAQMMKAVSGGGWRTHEDTGKRYFNNFDGEDPSGRNKRPSWQSEYAHFLYGKALYHLGVQKKDKLVLEEALLTLDDLPVPGGEKGQTSGGFLGRFANGNSRFYPEALALKARTLVAIGNAAEATKAFGELAQHAVSVPLHPMWAYEAAIGPGLIKEAQGDESGAIDAYNAASGVVLAMIERELRACLQLELGRLYSRARGMGTSVELRMAEKGKNRALLKKLQTELLAESPEALRRKYRTKTKSVQDALVRGARDPLVRAVAGNGIGLAYLVEKRYEEAILALKEVTVVYFEIAEQALRAHYYLAQAANEAGKAAKDPKTKAMYEAIAAESKAALKGTEWENK